MSDNENLIGQGQYPEYQERSEAELKSLTDSFRKAPVRNYVAPPAPGWDVHGLWHCLAGETEVFTKDGPVPIRSLAGREVEVLTADGGPYARWVTASFASFGSQQLYRIGIRRNGQTKVIRATEKHRWFGSTSLGSPWQEITTDGLKKDMRLRSVSQPRSGNISVSSWAVAHGFTFGDGHREAHGTAVTLWGEKDAAVEAFFPWGHRYPYETDAGLPGTRITGLPNHFKEYPDLSESPSYLYGWLAGYFAADGCVDDEGRPTLGSVERENLVFVDKVCRRLGIFTYGIHKTEPRATGFSSDPAVHYTIAFGRSALSEDFFVIKEHRKRWLARKGGKERRDWRVDFVEPTGDVEEVFCATVPETHAFCLEGNLLTGNCFGSMHRTGYATHALALHWMLSKTLSIPTELTPHRALDIDITRFPKDRNDLLFGWTKEAVGHPHVLFCSFPLEVAAEMDGASGVIVPYCAFEGDLISKYAIDLATGPVFAKIWVVSQFVKNAFVASGVPEDRVDVIRPMICDGFWKMAPIEEMVAAKSRPVTHDDPFTFGVLGTWQKRKGMFDLLRAYFSTFKREEPVRLVIRTSPLNEHTTIRAFKEQIVKDVAAIAAEFGDTQFPTSKKMPRLDFELGTDLTDQQVVDWLGTLDCYANPSYGEGLGIPHVWSKAQGVPMVSSDYGAVGQYLTELASHEYNPGASPDYLFSARLAPVDPEMLKLGLMFERRTRWGTYEVARLGQSMRDSFSQGRVVDVKAAEYTRRAFGPDTIEPLKKALARILPEERAKEWLYPATEITAS